MVGRKKKSNEQPQTRNIHRVIGLQFSRVFIGSGNSDEIQAMNKAVEPAKEKRKLKNGLFVVNFNSHSKSQNIWKQAFFFRSSAELKE